MQRHLDEQKLGEVRKKEAYLLAKEAHYQEEQQRVSRMREAEENAAVTKLLLQAKLGPTPSTAGPALKAKKGKVYASRHGLWPYGRPSIDQWRPSP